MKIYSVSGTSKRNVKFGFYNRDDTSIIRKIAHTATIKQSLNPFLEWNNHKFHFDNFFIHDEETGELLELKLTERIFIERFADFRSMPDLFTTTNGSDLIVSEKLKRIIESQLDTGSSFFPIKLFSFEYYFWFIMPTKKILNIEKSKIDWDLDLVYYAKKEEEICFNQIEINRRAAFRLPFSGELIGRYFFSEEFYKTLMDSKLNISVAIHSQTNFYIV